MYFKWNWVNPCIRLREAVVVNPKGGGAKYHHFQWYAFQAQGWIFWSSTTVKIVSSSKFKSREIKTGKDKNKTKCQFQEDTGATPPPTHHHITHFIRQHLTTITGKEHPGLLIQASPTVFQLVGLSHKTSTLLAYFEFDSLLGYQRKMFITLQTD